MSEQVKELFYAVQHGLHPSTATKKYYELRDAEIEKLQKELESEKEVSRQHCADAVKLQKENARYRVALEDISETDCGCEIVNDVWVKCVKCTAKEALKEPKDA